jgi:hypothetical protein
MESTTMSEIEEIDAAITKLTAEREAAMRGPWVANENFGYYGGSFGIEGGLEDEWEDSPGYALEKTDAELITTLHRTIDAQIELLRLGASFLASVGISTSTITSPLIKGIIALAKSINGTPS